MKKLILNYNIITLRKVQININFPYLCAPKTEDNG